jgi:hypothetical protein
MRGGFLLFASLVALCVSACKNTECEQQQKMTVHERAMMQQFKAVITILAEPTIVPPKPGQQRSTYVYKKVKVFRLMKLQRGEVLALTAKCHSLAFFESTTVRQLFYNTQEEPESCRPKLKVGQTYFLGGRYETDEETQEHIFYLDPCYQDVVAKLSSPGPARNYISVAKEVSLALKEEKVCDRFDCHCPTKAPKDRFFERQALNEVTLQIKLTAEPERILTSTSHVRKYANVLVEHRYERAALWQDIINEPVTNPAVLIDQISVDAPRNVNKVISKSGLVLFDSFGETEKSYEVRERMKALMKALATAFDGPEFAYLNGEETFAAALGRYIPALSVDSPMYFALNLMQQQASLSDAPTFLMSKLGESNFVCFMDNSNDDKLHTHVFDARDNKFKVSGAVRLILEESGKMHVITSLTHNDPAATTVTFSKPVFPPKKSASRAFKAALDRVEKSIFTRKGRTLSIPTDRSGNDDLCLGAKQSKWKTVGAVDVMQRVVTSTECSRLMEQNTAYLVSGTWKDEENGRRVVTVKQCFGIAAPSEFGFFSGRGAYNDLKKLEKCKA